MFHPKVAGVEFCKESIGDIRAPADQKIQTCKWEYALAFLEKFLMRATSLYNPFVHICLSVSVPSPNNV